MHYYIRGPGQEGSNQETTDPLPGGALDLGGRFPGVGARHSLQLSHQRRSLVQAECSSF